MKKALPFSSGIVHFFETESPKCACIISKKILKTSPKRHYYKRLVYSSWKQNKEKKTGTYIFIFKQIPQTTKKVFIEEISSIIKLI